MVLSLNTNKKKILCLLALIALIVIGAIFIPKLIDEPEKFPGETESERISFLESFGYTLDPEPLDCRTVTIPKEFNDIYSKYNDMQKAQGFDLKPYRGKECTQYIYLIENYPGEEREIHATLLVREGIIIGGDVCCAEVDGFMHGFALDSEYYGGGNSVVVTSSAPREQETAVVLEEQDIPEEAYPTD